MNHVHPRVPAPAPTRWALRSLILCTCLAAPTVHAQFTERLAVYRQNRNGTPDTTFGNGGGANITNLAGSTYEGFNAGALTRVNAANDRLIAGGTRQVAGGTNLVFGRYVTSTGVADNTFGSQGFVTLNVPGVAREGVSRVAVDSMRRIVFFGTLQETPDRYQLLVGRLTPAGAWDVSFNGTGYRIYNLTAKSSDFGVGLAVDASNRVFITGSSGQSDWRAFIACFRDSGALDPSFGSGGVVQTQPAGMSTTQWNDIAFDLNGRIVVTGETGVGGTTPAHFAVAARFSSAGAPDTGFGTSGTGVVQITDPSNALLYALDIAPDGINSYTISGQAVNRTTGAKDVLVVRLLESGAYDNMWSGDGRLITSLGANTRPWAWRAVFPLHWMTAALVVTGYVERTDGYRQFAIGYNFDGSPYASWGMGTGIIQSQVGGYTYSGFSDAVTNGSDGKVITFGWVDND